MNVRNCLVNLLVRLLCLPLIVWGVGCSSSSSSESDSKSSWHYENDFVQNPLLAATPRDVIILAIPARAESEAPQIFTHEIPFVYETQELVVFCLDTDDGLLTSMELVDDRGQVVLELNHKTPCLHATLEPGRYTKRIFHDSTSVHSVKSSVAFMHPKGIASVPDATGASKTPQNDSPPIPTSPAYGALVLQNGPYAGDYLVTTATPSSIMGMSFNTLKSASVETDKDLFADLKHLYSFKAVGDPKEAIHADEDASPTFFGDFEFLSWKNPPFTYWDGNCETDPELCVANQAHPFNTNTVVFPVFENIQPLTAYLEAKNGDLFSVWTSSAYVFIHDHTAIYPEANKIFYYTDYAKDGSPPAIFKTDPRFRFYEDGSDVGELQDGEAAIFEGPNYSGRAWVLKPSSENTTLFEDMTLLPITQFASIKVEGDFTNLMLYKNEDSDQWVMTVGINIAQLDPPIAGGEIGSLRLFNAMKYFISNRECEHCYLAGAELHDLSLDKVDLSYADLTNVDFYYSSLRNSSLYQADLHGANLNYANLEQANLQSALLNGSEASLNVSASLVGAFLKNANLASANMTGANFSNANFFSDTDNECTPSEWNTNQDNPTCASAVSATMDAVNFSNAYLAGLDMSSASIKATVFSGAILTGAHLNSSDLSRDPNSRTSFTGAFIQGADFTNATAEGADFTDTYVDLDYKGCMMYRIPGTNTQFTGYWNTPGDSPCVMFTYSDTTIVPATKSSNNCPNGTSGPCDGKWTTPKDAYDKSKASYCPGLTDDAPVCQWDDIDPKW